MEFKRMIMILFFSQKLWVNFVNRPMVGRSQWKRLLLWLTWSLCLRLIPSCCKTVELNCRHSCLQFPVAGEHEMCAVSGDHGVHVFMHHRLIGAVYCTSLEKW